MFDWNFGYYEPNWNVRIGGGVNPTWPGQFPGQVPIYGPGVIPFQQNNQMVWLLIIVVGGFLLLKD